MDAMQRYLVEEEVEHYQHGEITHAELTRRVTLILGSSALALSVLTALGCGVQMAAFRWVTSNDPNVVAGAPPPRRPGFPSPPACPPPPPSRPP